MVARVPNPVSVWPTARAAAERRLLFLPRFTAEIREKRQRRRLDRQTDGRVCAERKNVAPKQPPESETDRAIFRLYTPWHSMEGLMTSLVIICGRIALIGLL